MVDEITKIENRASVVSKREDDIIYIYIRSDLDFEIQDVDDIGSSVRQLYKGKKLLLLVDVSDNTTGNNEVREYAAKKGINKYAAATAYITNSLAQKLIVNFFIALYRKDTPSKMFINEKDAIAWLKEYE